MIFSRRGRGTSMMPWQHLPIIALARLVGLCLFIGFSLLIGDLLNNRPAYAHSTTTVTITDCRDDTQLRSAINSATAGEIINFDCPNDRATIPITIANGPLTIAVSLTLDGSGQSITLDGQNSVQVLHVNPNVTFTLKHLTISKGSSPTNGGGILNFGTTTIINSTFTNNTATGLFGGSIVNAPGAGMTIIKSIIANNTASHNGGGILNFGTTTIIKSVIANNTALTGSGSGILNFGTTTIIKSCIINNTAGFNGGGIGNENGARMTIIKSVIANNTANGPNGGGGINNFLSTMTINDSHITDNRTSSNGGGIDNNAGKMTINESSITNNNASSNGGGIANVGGSMMTINKSHITDNTASGNGGGIFNGGSTVTISKSVLRNNHPNNCAPPGTITNKGGNRSSDNSCGF